VRREDEQSFHGSCFNKAQPREMLFVLLGRDKSAPVAIRAWVDHRVATGKNQADDLQITEALRCAEVMEKEQANYGPRRRKHRARELAG
jgi:hypothetical protein